MSRGTYTPHHVAGYKRFVVEGLRPVGWKDVVLTTYRDKPVMYDKGAPGFHSYRQIPDKNGRVVFNLPTDVVWAVVELYDYDQGGYVYLE